jgi:hypothetical protein
MTPGLSHATWNLKLMRCSLYKSLALFFLDSEKRPACLDRHLRSCAACREWIETQDHLAFSLKKEARHEPGCASKALPARIMHSLETLPAKTPPPQVFWRSPLAWSGAAAAAAVLAFFVVGLQRPDETLPEAPNSSASVSLQTDLYPFMTRATSDAVDPLEMEITYLKEDFKRAAELFIVPF